MRASGSPRAFAIFGVAVLVAASFAGAFAAVSVLAPTSPRAQAAPPSTAQAAADERGIVSLFHQLEPALKTSEPLTLSPSLARAMGTGWPNFDPLEVLLVGVAFGFLCASLALFSAGIGCLVLLIALGVGLLVWEFSTLFALQAEASALYGPAEGTFSALLSHLADNVSQTAAIAYNLATWTDSLTALYGYEASAAVFPQIANLTFSVPQDLIDAGIATEMLSVLQGPAFGVLADLLGFWTSVDNLYGPGGKYGANGLVCMATVTSNFTYSNGSIDNATLGPIPDVASSNLNWGSDGGCNEDIGVEQSGSVIPTDNASGLLLPINTSFTPTYLADNPSVHPYFDVPLQVYVAPGAAFDAAGDSPHGTLIPLTSQPATGCSCLVVNVTGPYGAADNATHAVDVAWGVPTALNLTPGLYGIDNEALQSGNSYSFAWPNETHLLGINVLPFEFGQDGTSEDERADTSFGAIGMVTDYLPENPAAVPTVLYSCGETEFADSAVNPYLHDYTGNNLSSVDLCPTMLRPVLGDVMSEMDAAGIIGEGYWSFLHTLGVYSIDALPVNCSVLAPSNFLSPDVTLDTVLGFTPREIENLMLAYVREGSGNYGPYSLSDANYCGIHAPPPGNVTLTNPYLALVGDAYTHEGSQVFGTLSSWLFDGYGMQLFPSDGNVSIPVNETWEAPAANPINLYYGPTVPSPLNATNVGTAELDLYDGGELPTFLGNSTSRQGSVWPNDTDARLGAGDALYLTGCWKESGPNGTWSFADVCNVTVTVLNYTQPHGSNGCYFLGICNINGSGGYQLPTAVDCGFSLASDLAQPFANLSLGGLKLGVFACFIGWILTIAIIAVVVVVAVAVARSVARSRRGDD